MLSTKQPNPIISGFLKTHPKVSKIIFNDAVFYKKNNKMCIEHTSEVYLNQIAFVRNDLEKYFNMKIVLDRKENKS